MPIDPNATLPRSIITHVTVTLALVSLLIFGGPTIHSFTAAMTFGAVLVGSYTSIFIAAPLLGMLKDRDPAYAPQKGHLSLGPEMAHRIGDGVYELDPPDYTDLRYGTAQSLG